MVADQNSVKKSIPDALLFSLEPLQDDQPDSSRLLGYYMKSTAPTYVEDEIEGKEGQSSEEVKNKLQRIAYHLVDSQSPEIVLHIHGYAVTEKGAQSSYKQAYQYAIDEKLSAGNHVLIGYRWPAQNPKESFWNNFHYAFQALPTLPLNLLIIAFVVVMVSWLLSWHSFTAIGLFVFPLVALIALLANVLIWQFSKAKGYTDSVRLSLVLFALLIAAMTTLTPIARSPTSFLAPLTGLFAILFGVIFALIALRLVTYPHDRYRALNYAVIDLIAFFRQLEIEVRKLDQQIEHPINQADPELNQDTKQHEVVPRKIAKEAAIGDKLRIKVSFIAHSLGCETTTHTVRALSDVFDPNAVEGKPSSAIGSVFSLGRLVMAAPDIPIEAVLGSRANFLKSSLRRFEEAYIFSNEGDLALRLASTAANYFTFPFRNRLRGYKLGNITAWRNPDEKQVPYGILNFDFETGRTGISHNWLEIRASKKMRVSLKNLRNCGKLVGKETDSLDLDKDAVANGFTYFDCTDYIEKGMGVLSLAPRKSAFDWIDYTRLVWKYFFQRQIDPHGGYFAKEAIFSRELIYKLAFLGYQQLLLDYQKQSPGQQPFQQQTGQLFQRFSGECEAKQIQVVLASRDAPNLDPALKPKTQAKRDPHTFPDF
jgi:hypothetical protein